MVSLTLPWPQQASTPAKGSQAQEKSSFLDSSHSTSPCIPRERGSGSPAPILHEWGNRGAERQRDLLKADKVSCRAGFQPREPSGLLQGWEGSLRPARAGLPSPLSSSGPFSRRPGASPKFIDGQGSLESIWCTLLINLFQVIAGNWLVCSGGGEVTSAPPTPRVASGRARDTNLDPLRGLLPLTCLSLS